MDNLSSMDSNALLELGIKHYQADQLDHALRCFESLHEREPKSPQFLSNIGLVHKKRGDYLTAVAYYQQALALSPSDAGILSNAGNAIWLSGDLQGGLDHQNRALKLEPNNPSFIYNRGLVLRDMQLLGEAIDCFDCALQLKPDFPYARWDRALTYLTAGELLIGFKEYEARWPIHKISYPRFKQPLWQGDMSQKVLIHWEQGFGDSLQFVRYLPLLKQRLPHLSFCTQKPLLSLLHESFADIELCCHGAALPEFDAHFPLMSLPRIFQTRLDTLPQQTPYLSTTQKCPIKFPRNKLKKVGFCWTGKPSHQNDHNRSCSLEDFKPLFKTKGVQWFNLQLDQRREQLTQLPKTVKLVDAAPHLNSFADTAALMQKLDLIISVDTAVAHLAGALGRPCWVVLPFAPDWRWLLTRRDSPWYPSLKLYRQTQPKDWQVPIEAIKKALATFAKR